MRTEELQRASGCIAVNHQSVTSLYKSTQSVNSGHRAETQRSVTFRSITLRADFYREAVLELVSLSRNNSLTWPCYQKYYVVLRYRTVYCPRY